MTPWQLAKAECADLLADGTCVFIEPSSWWDFSLELPRWLRGAEWRALVAEARPQGEDTIVLDKRNSQRLDRDEPHANRHRLDLYYCPGCGRRMGCVRAVCLSCQGTQIVPDDVDRRCRIVRGLRCATFEEAILPLADQPSPPDEPRLQGRRLAARQAYLRAHGLPGGDGPRRRCPDCKAVLAKRQRYCSECRRKRRRASDRARWQKKVQDSAVDGGWSDVSPYRTKGAEGRKTQGDPQAGIPRSGRLTAESGGSESKP